MVVPCYWGVYLSAWEWVWGLEGRSVFKSSFFLSAPHLELIKAFPLTVDQELGSASSERGARHSEQGWGSLPCGHRPSDLACTEKGICHFVLVSPSETEAGSLCVVPAEGPKLEGAHSGQTSATPDPSQASLLPSTKA